MSTILPSQPIKLYGVKVSGHCHKVELLMSLMNLPCEYVVVNLMAGEHKSPQFLARNSFGQVPVIEDGDVTLADSHAILVYLELRYGSGRWLPRDPIGAANVQRWLAASAGPLAFGPAASRVVELFKTKEDTTALVKRAHQLFGAMERELTTRPFLVGESATLADVANYGYTACAPEGNVSLSDYPRIRTWLQRVEALSGFVPVPQSPVGLRAA